MSNSTDEEETKENILKRNYESSLAPDLDSYPNWTHDTIEDAAILREYAGLPVPELSNNVNTNKIIWVMHGITLTQEKYIYSGFPFKNINFYAGETCILVAPPNSSIFIRSICAGHTENRYQINPNSSKEIKLQPMIFNLDKADEHYANIGVYLCVKETHDKPEPWIECMKHRSRSGKNITSYYTKVADYHWLIDKLNRLGKPITSADPSKKAISYHEIVDLSQQILRSYRYNPSNFELCLGTCRTTKEDVISIATSQKTIKDIPITPLSSTSLPGLIGPPSTTPSRNTSPLAARQNDKKGGRYITKYKKYKKRFKNKTIMKKNNSKYKNRHKK
jgi:hypothetical protein